MQLAVKKWGNSVGIRIPATILASLKLQAESLIDLREEDGKIIIEPIKPQYNLAQMLAEITPENLHSEISTGSPVGNESL